MTAPKPKQVYDNPDAYWDFVTVTTDASWLRCKFSGRSKRPVLCRADFKPQAPRSRLQAQLGLGRPDLPV